MVGRRAEVKPIVGPACWRRVTPLEVRRLGRDAPETVVFNHPHRPAARIK